MKKIVFLTGTRADFGKLKSLIDITHQTDDFEVHIFATGMHMHTKYGYTVNEIEKCGYNDIYKFINHTDEQTMDMSLAKTIEGFSNYCREFTPELIIVHGDRLEALAGAIVGAMNNILVAHIEGGELSGTIDELIRHSVSKMSHSHFVAHKDAKKRLIQMGEEIDSIFEIGSPDIDIMLSENLPSIDDVKESYDIKFKKFGLLLLHPVTTETELLKQNVENLVQALIEFSQNIIVVMPNNDLGSSKIIEAYKALEANTKFKIYPSIRFENFLVLMKNAQFIIGNSSAGIREAPYYGLPTINLGNRQANRSSNSNIINCSFIKKEMLEALSKTKNLKIEPNQLYGTGSSDLKFLDIIKKEKFWEIKKQKLFRDL